MNNEAGRKCDYIGFLTARVGKIRDKKTSRGHEFLVYHAPEEGDWHAVIKIAVANGLDNLSKNDKADIRAVMKDLFEPNFTVV